MAESKIEWTDYTFNPWWGCEKVSPGCAHCYADTLAKRRVPGAQLWGAGHGFRFFGDGHWAEPHKWNRKAERDGVRLRVFCASMADVFEERPELDEHRERLFETIEETPHLDWQVLTKRPEAAADFFREFYWGDFKVLPNLWIGVSIENARFTWRADVLREIPAAVRFISAEPLLGSLYPSICGRVDIDASFYSQHAAAPSDRGICTLDPGHSRGCEFRSDRSVAKPLDLTGIDWIIVGGESGPGARPFHLEHAREIIQAARDLDPTCICYPGCRGIGDCEPACPRCSSAAASAPAVFVKQLGAKPTRSIYAQGLYHPIFKYDELLKLRDRKGGDWDEWPADLRIREFPRSAAQ